MLACGTLALRPGIEPRSLVLEVQSLIRWTPREVLSSIFNPLISLTWLKCLAQTQNFPNRIADITLLFLSLMLTLMFTSITRWYMSTWHDVLSHVKCREGRNCVLFWNLCLTHSKCFSKCELHIKDWSGDLQVTHG